MNQTSIIAKNQLWMNASRTIGIAAIHGQTYGIISKSHVITDNVKTISFYYKKNNNNYVFNYYEVKWYNIIYW